MESAAPRNLMLEEIEYHFEETAWGTWRRFVYPNGQRFAEYTSHRRWGDLPLMHYTFGKCPETGKRIVARGVIAVGRLAWGIIAIGQAAMGLVAIGQVGFGLVFGLGQAALGFVCIGQLALGMLVGIGQFATGYVAVGQFAIGTYALAQFAFGDHVVDMRKVDPAAKDFFLELIGK